MDDTAVEEIRLQIFGQQVGGHSLLLKLSEQAVCKPLMSREQFFYESIPQELRSYTPEYYGVCLTVLDVSVVFHVLFTQKASYGLDFFLRKTSVWLSRIQGPYTLVPRQK